MRKHLRTIAIVGAVIAVCFLAGIPGRPDQGSETERESTPQPVPPSTAMAASGDQQASSPGATAPIRGPAGNADLALADEFGGLIYTLNNALTRGELGAACAALDAAEDLPLEADLLAGRERARDRVARALTTQTKALTALVEQGKVVRARRTLERMRSTPHEAVETALAEQHRSRDWPAWTGGKARLGAPIDPPTSLAADRRVRIHFRDRWTEGVVVGTALRSGDGQEEVTVRLNREGQVLFPFVTRCALEPVDASVGEAVDQARAAMRSGDTALAALWVCHCMSAGHTDHADVKALAERLPR